MLPSTTPAKRATKPDNWHSIGSRQACREKCSCAAKHIVQLLSNDSLEKITYLRNHGGAGTDAVVGHDARWRICRFRTLRIILRTHTDTRKDIYDATDAYGFERVEFTRKSVQGGRHELTSSLLDVASVRRIFLHGGQVGGEALFLSAANPGRGDFVNEDYLGRTRELDTSTTRLISKDNRLGSSCLLSRLITSKAGRIFSTATEQAIDAGRKAIGGRPCEGCNAYR
jgi:hypothetical protein